MATVLEFLSYNIIEKDMYDSLIESPWLILSFSSKLCQAY